MKSAGQVLSAFSSSISKRPRRFQTSLTNETPKDVCIFPVEGDTTAASESFSSRLTHINVIFHPHGRRGVQQSTDIVFFVFFILHLMLAAVHLSYNVYIRRCPSRHSC